jgi:hypothetical protein
MDREAKALDVEPMRKRVSGPVAWLEATSDFPRPATVRLQLVERQADAEAGVAGLGADAEVAAVLADDAHGVVEAEAEALAGRLGGEERLEDAVLQLGRNAGAGVPDFHQQHVAFKAAGCGAEGSALVAERVERVFNERGPDLVQLAAVGADAGQVGLVVALTWTLSDARLEHLQRGVEAGGHIDFEDGRAVHVGVGLDGADEVEDAGGGVDKRFDRARGAQVAGEVLQGDADLAGPRMARSSSRSATVTDCSANCAATSQASGRRCPREPGANAILRGDEAESIGWSAGGSSDSPVRSKIFCSQASMASRSALR